VTAGSPALITIHSAVTVCSYRLIQCNTVNILRHITFKDGMAMFHFSSQTCATSNILFICHKSCTS